jgi:hypothetical protein
MDGKVSMTQTRTNRAAEHAHAVDAASRPQDRRFFERRAQLDRFPDLAVAARLMGRPLN